MLPKRGTCWILFIMCLVFVSTTLAQDTGAAVRLVQIFYQNADVYLDGVLVVPGLAFTVATDFMPLSAGDHTIGVTAKDTDIEAGSAVTLGAVDGHQYTIITMGEFEDGTPNLQVIDETEEFVDYDPNGNNAIIVQNLPGAVPVDVWFEDELKIENLIFGGYGTANAQLGQFSARAVMAGNPNMVMFESEYFAVPGTVSLAYLSGTFPDIINRTFFTTSTDTMADYLSAHATLENSKLTTLYDLLTTSGLLEILDDETQFTLFAPTNDAFAALPAGVLDALKGDPAALANVLKYHLVEGRWTPYELTGEHALITVQGESLDVMFQPVEIPLSVNGNPTGLQHRVGNGVIYLINTVLLPAGE